MNSQTLLTENAIAMNHKDLKWIHGCLLIIVCSKLNDFCSHCITTYLSNLI